MSQHALQVSPRRRGGWVSQDALQVSPRGGVSPIWGGSGPGGSPIFRGGLQFFGGSPNFVGGLQFFRGVSNLSGGFSNFSEYGQCSAGTHPTGMHSCLLGGLMNIISENLKRLLCTSPPTRWLHGFPASAGEIPVEWKNILRP